MLAQAASLFVLGELKLSPTADAVDELHVAAAATFEFFLQNIARPGAHERKLVRPTPAQKREGYEISKLLKPWNAPEIFQRSVLKTVGDEILLVISPAVSVRLGPATIEWLKHYARPWWQKKEEEVTLRQVVDSLQLLLAEFSLEERWIDD